MYYYLHTKTRMNLRFLYIDNLIVAGISFAISFLLYSYLFSTITELWRFFFALASGGIFVVALGYALTMIRFWHTPKRKISAGENEIISPADGNVLYIKRIEAGDTPIAIKDGKMNVLQELTKTDLVNRPCWLIGINMTPWDVHKNCAPIDGSIRLNQHTKGEFLSLKLFDALSQNERNTYVIENERLKVGIVQIASKGVRRIDSYVKEGDIVQKGDWLGMIRFGSQVDLILPYTSKVTVTVGQQVYAAKTIIAEI